MNKKFMLIVLSVILVSGYADAQFILCNSLPHSSHVAEQQTRSAGKTTASASRVINEIRYHNDSVSFIPVDSTYLVYSGGRGGDLTHPIKFDAGYVFNYNSASFSYSINELVVHTYDANNNIINEVAQYWSPAFASLRNNQQTLLTYDGRNNLLTDIVQNWDTVASAWVNAAKYTSTYDGGNDLTEYLTQIWNSGTSLWIDQNDETYTYTSANKIATAIYKNWNTQTGTWDNYSKTLNSYDVSSNLIIAVNQDWNSATNGWDNNYQDTYTYDAMNDQLTDLNQSWNSTAGTWDNYSKKTFSSFVAQQPQLEVDQNWNPGSSAFVNSLEFTNTYNSFNQLTYQYTQNWNTGGYWEVTPSNQAYRYGYENYNTKVQNITSNGGEALVYPVPAKNILSLSVTWDMSQAFSITIIDLQGKIIRQWEMPATLQYNNSISINYLLPGNYILKIDGAEGSITKKLTITN